MYWLLRPYQPQWGLPWRSRRRPGRRRARWTRASSRNATASTRRRRTTAPKARIPAPGRRRRRAIRSPSCCFPRATAPRSRAARRRPPDRERALASHAAPLRTRDSIPAKAGVGLRFRHHQEVLEARPAAAWFEVHTENYLGGGSAPAYVDAIRRDYPVSLHGTGLSLGSAEGLDPAHLARVRELVERTEPGLVSEHLSFSVAAGNYLADLLPLPLTEEALEIVCRNVAQVQDHLKRRILVENPSTYLQFRHSTIPEWEFLTLVARRTGCGILCDVNNIYVSASNHGWRASAYLAALPPEAVGEIHLAGHSLRRLGEARALLIADHGSRVAPEVWALYAEALALFGRVPTLIEWDTDVPPMAVLLEEAAHAAALIDEAESGNGHALAA